MVADKCPELINQWHPTLNGEHTPYNTSYGSGYQAWWILEYYDDRTGNSFVFEWPAAVYHRTKGEGCPYLTGKKVYPGFNDLATICPSIAEQVHPVLNGGLTACDIFAFSNKKIWWIYPYDDPISGKHYDFEWEAEVASRVNGNGCPFISNQRLWKGYNDFATRYPKLAEQWNYSLNKKRPEDYMPNSKEEVWWIYPYDDPVSGKHFDFEWKARITNRVQDNGGCPFLSGNAVWVGYNDLPSKRQDLADQWDYKKNRVKPTEVSLFSNTKRWWVCPECQNSWYASPAKRAAGQECKCMQARY